MFGTIEEAEQAARMLRRVIGREAVAGGPFDGGPSTYYVQVVAEAHRTEWLWSWEAVADLIEGSRVVFTIDYGVPR